MADFSFIHTADLHLDTPFTGLGAVDASLADSLRNASLRAFDSIIDLALDRSVDFVIFAGDIYDGADRGLRAQVAFKRGLQRLEDAGIRSFVIHGNHDPLDGWSLIREFPKSTHVFRSDCEAIRVEKDGQVIATVHGISYDTNHVHENLALRYESTKQGFQIGVLHTDVDSPGSPYAPCTLDDLIGRGMDYWALGHIHSRRELCNDPLVVYPGNTQGRSFNEEGPRGVSVVTVRDGRVRGHDFVAVDQWRFATVMIDLEPIVDVADLADAIFDEVERTSEDCSRVVRVRLEGRSELHGELARSSTEPLLDELRVALSEMRPRVWLARIDDRSRPPVNIEQLRQRDDFANEVIKVADSWPDVVGTEQAVPKKYRRALSRYVNGHMDDPAIAITDARDLALEFLLSRGT